MKLIVKLEARAKWRAVLWSPPDGEVVPICSCCCGELPDVPLQLWDNSGATAHFCDRCVEQLFEAE